MARAARQMYLRNTSVSSSFRCKMGAKVVAEKSTGALRSPVSWALLGLVIQRPSYGYELVQRFERTFADALDLSSLSQIYTALDTLGRRALVEEFVADNDEDGAHAVVRQPKLHYRATAEGVRHYEQWLVGQIHEERRRSRLFARQLSVLPPRTALGIIERCERACLEEAKSAHPGAVAHPVASHAEARAKAAAKRSDDSAPGLTDRLLCEEGRLAVEARLAWLEYARRELQALLGEHAPGR
jgi:DNA-binding PadR family transcriptional regulator